MKVSVVVPTFNRSTRIPLILNALENQSFKDFETIVINDGSTDDTESVLEYFAEKSPLNIRHFSIDNAGRAGSRNFGFKRAHGELIIFFDDDTRPGPETVKLHVQCHQRLDRALVSGPYLYDESKFSNQFNRFRKTMESQWYQPVAEAVRSNSLRINGGNFSIRKIHLEQLGGFDERLRDKEDFKLSYDFSIKCKGSVYVLFPAWVFHDDFSGLLAYIDRERTARREEQKLLALEPDLVSMFPERLAPPLPRGIKALVPRFFRKTKVVELFDRLINTRMLSSAVSYKIYDWIVTMNIRYL